MRAHMTRRRRGRSAHRSRKIQSRRRTWRHRSARVRSAHRRSRSARVRSAHRRQRGGMYNSVIGRDGIPHSDHDPTVVIKTIDGVPTAMSADTYERDYKATGEDVGQI
jgi:hypothetical protein